MRRITYAALLSFALLFHQPFGHCVARAGRVALVHLRHSIISTQMSLCLVRRFYPHPVKRAILLLLAVFSGCAHAGDSLESRFARERASLFRVEGTTSEESCGGTGLAVYLRGEQVRHLDWTIEASREFIRRQYYFDGSTPRLALETIHAKFDSHAEPLSKPRLISRQRYRLDTATPTEHEKQLRAHAAFLLQDFYQHRQDFSRAPNPSA
jgi:hypothetical protein